MNAFDVAVIGSGPAGQKAAIQAAKAGRRTLVVESESTIGGACVHRGTIPSKTLRETAVALVGFRRRSGEVVDVALPAEVQLESLMTRMSAVVQAHERFIDDQLRRNEVVVWRGMARFLGPHELEIETAAEGRRRITADKIVIACGSRPRAPEGIAIDHEHILDSDSILSMSYLPASLVVLGAGVIASEYASIFAALGVQVTMIDRAARPVGFLDPELTTMFVRSFEGLGARFLGERAVKSVEWNGLGHVVTTLKDGEQLWSEKVLVALGRVANVDGLDIERAGLKANGRGLLEVDAHGCTAVPHIYAAGDVIGPPSLASTSMEQGRRSMRHALGLESSLTASAAVSTSTIPLGLYTIPEMSSVGATEAEMIAAEGKAVIGRARFDELARGQIAAIPDGLLKLVTGADGRRLRGVQVIGEGACELVHLGQIAILAGWDVDNFIENIFNFPTLAEAYRVAALDIVKQR